MAENKNKQTNKLPNFAPRIVVTILLIWIVIFIGEWLQDKAHQKELLDIQKISLYHQQLEFSGALMNTVMAFRLSDNEIKFDSIQQKLQSVMSHLKWTQDELLELANKESSIVETEVFVTEQKVLAQEIEKIIIFANQMLATMEGEAETETETETETEKRQYIGQLYKKTSPIAQRYQTDNLHLVTKLIQELHDDSDQEKRISNWVSVITMALILIVSMGIYWPGKRLTHKQFNLVHEANKKLEKENYLRQGAEHLALTDKMKLSAVLNSTVDAIITINGEGLVESFNKAAESMFGYPAERVIGSNVKMLMPEPFHSEHDGYLETHLRTGVKAIIGMGREVMAARVDGSEFPIFLSVSKVEIKGDALFTGIIRDITESKKGQKKLHHTLQQLTDKQNQLDQQEKIARHVFEKITSTNSDSIPELAFWNEPMGSFSGDMMLSSVLPDGSLRIVLCDFTGHGLPAALGAMPVSSIHSAIAAKNLPLEVLMDELNDKLGALLPIGFFCCISGIDISKETMQARIWNAGLPDVLLVSQSGKIKQRFSSEHLPIGVAAYAKQELRCEQVAIEAGDCFYASSDGLTEAENKQGEMFGKQKFEQILTVATKGGGRLAGIRETVTSYMDGTPATDDILLIEIKILATEESSH
ncbi:MAG: hypothetical protein COB23_04155 [Methylophaga sp.]|nr:MAG: hypothetical protein COB23_04155 [Methylophaga sp.]